jgi:hypothetical protein
MKIKYFYMLLVLLIALSIISGLFAGDVSQVNAQLSRLWSDPINLSNSGGATDPMMVIDASGVFHVLWVDKYDGYKYSQSADGKGWGVPVKVKYPFVPQSRSQKLVAGFGSFIHVFWQGINNELLYSQANSSNLDEPSTWSFRNKISNTVLAFDIVVDTTGIAHLAFIRSVDSELGPAGVYYVRSLDNGRTWSSEKLLYESQYFRTLLPDNAHIRVSVSGDAGGQGVFVVWDNTSLKRIFMSASVNSGVVWSDVVQVKGPEDTGGYNMPFNIEINVWGEKALLLWQAGEPGAVQCSLYAQWSTDGGVTWGKAEPMLDDRSICPAGTQILTRNDDSLVVLLEFASGNPSLISWNGTQWSILQTQDELSYFSNHLVHESLLLESHFYYSNGEHLFLVASDQGDDGDVWIISRPLVPASDWFFSSSLWSLPGQLTSTSQNIPFITYVGGGKKLYTLWLQSPPANAGISNDSVYYSNWDGLAWSSPADVSFGLTGTVDWLSAVTDEDNRMFVAWSDQDQGDLLFSWTNIGGVNDFSEWATLRGVPAPSQWTSSPDILVDADGQLVIVYAVPFNEKRGIYMVRSTDFGDTWSEPVSVFDAESADWNMVNRPKIALSGDGRLHVLFIKYSGLDYQPDGLYYSQSRDGGSSWDEPNLVKNGAVFWSEIVAVGEGMVHRLWQQNDEAVVANIHQFSADGGDNWGKAVDITDVSDTVMPVTLASNNLGDMHFIQAVQERSSPYFKEYTVTIKDWCWDGSQWESQPSQQIGVDGDNARFSLAAGISPGGDISVSLLARYNNLDGELKNEIYNVDRLLDGFDANRKPFPAVIADSTAVPGLIEPAGTQPETPIVSATPFPVLYGDEPSAWKKNLAGVSIVLIAVVLTILIFFQRAGKGGKG